VSGPVRSYSDRLDVLRGWLGEETYLRLESVTSRRGQEIEAWILQAILDCLEAADGAAPAHEAKTGLDVRAALPPRPAGQSRLNAAHKRALEAFGRGEVPHIGPFARSALRGLVDATGITQAGRGELARMRAEQIAHEQALDEEP